MVVLAVISASAAAPVDDRQAFQRWFTFLVESRFYARKRVPEVVDGKSLVVWASRHALAQHDRRWIQTVELPVLPVIPAVRARPRADDLEPKPVSRSIADAHPGDLLLYDRPGSAAQLMVYVGRSQVMPSNKTWVVYWADGRLHKVAIESLAADPASEWRPLPENRYFLGVYRMAILGG